MGPFIGGFITTSHLGWRWTQYITAFMGFAACLLALFLQTESYPPTILVAKANKLRRCTRNWGIHAKQDEVEINFHELLTRNIMRPMIILFTEPIVLLVTIYMSFLYGLLYLLLTAYALIFQDVYGMSPGVGGLPYFAFIAGEVFGFIAVVLMNPGYVRKLRANNNIPVPEWRLPLVMVGAISFAAGKFDPQTAAAVPETSSKLMTFCALGLFWLGWTGYQGPSVIPWIVPTLSGLVSKDASSLPLQLTNVFSSPVSASSQSSSSSSTTQGPTIPCFLGTLLTRKRRSSMLISCFLHQH